MSDARSQLAEHLKFFGELGVPGLSTDNQWSRRPAASEDARTSDLEPRPSHAGPRTPDAVHIARSAAELLAAVQSDIGPACARCKLHTLGRTQVVFGVGNPDADLMFVGEAPGADEDVQGIPFVGRAGQLLTKMIEAINLRRDDVYIANVIKCRPPGNRNPEPDEIAECEPFLFQQIAAINPKVIVALGSFAAKTLLRSPDRKRDAWEDLKRARALLTAPVTAGR